MSEEPPTAAASTAEGPAAAPSDAGAATRRTAYVLMIAVAAGMMLGRLLAVDSVDTGALEERRLARIPQQLKEKRARLDAQGAAPHRIDQELARTRQALIEHARLSRPFLSANDRSRWCTVRALVDEEMRVPGAPYAIDKVIQEQGWDTIDMVKHGRRWSDEVEWPAAEPWVQKDKKHLYSSKPPLLPTLVAGIYWVVWQVTGMTLGSDPHAVVRIVLVLVNVLPLLIALVLMARLIERFGASDFGRLFTMAAAAFGTYLTTFAVVLNNHLIAAVSVVVAVYAAVRIVFDGRRNPGWFLLAGLFGAFAAANELPALSLLVLLGLVLLVKAPIRTALVFLPSVVLVAGAFFWTNWVAHHDLVPAYMHRSPGDNWYDYTYQCNGRTCESYWRNPVGVDQGEPSAAIYAMHVLVGHHGVFSLTPIWIFSAVGLLMWLFRAKDRRLRVLALLIGAITVACLGFYLSRPLHFRNYGGVTSGLRWLFWLTPLWLMTMLPAVDAAARRFWTRWLALAALVVSVLSASYPTWNPWSHPWLMVWLSYMGWGP